MKAPLLLTEVKHSEYIVTDFNEFGEEIETTLPENVHVYAEIDENDLRVGMANRFGLSL